jgi:hypothetical protein
MHIDVADEHALLRWAVTLGVSTDELRGAVNAVGDRVDDVRRFLQRGRDGDASAVPQHTV